MFIPFLEDYDKNVGSGQDETHDTKMKMHPLLVIRDKEGFKKRKESIVRNIDFILKWLHLKVVEGNRWWVDYLIAEGYQPPEDMSDVEVERIQAIPPIIIKASWAREAANKSSRKSNKAQSVRDNEAGPSVFTTDGSDRDYMDRSLHQD
ncbi:hypothetical protein SUGI_0738780 [Cryptomeria japonica]|nr:hypothetical protein SUGI_0738780 [Cryptomeria japonica]